MKTNTQKIVLASMLAAICCIMTMIIKIPSPLKGYLNLGDCVVLLSGWLLPPYYAFLAAGVGSALADVFAGYMMYVPATFVIKGLMAVIVHIFAVKMNHRIAGALLAEVLMVLGYFIFEACLYSVIPAAANIPANAIQGAVGIIIGLQLFKLKKAVDL